MKKSTLSLVIMTGILLNIFMISAVSDVSLRITGTIGDYSSDVRLRTDSNSNTGLDAYDMLAPSAPSSYSSFYSSITGNSLAIDSWNPATRTISLVYDMPTEQSGNVVFSWNQVTGTNYKATFSISGNSVNMADTSSYTYTASNASDIYITLNIEDYPTTTTPIGGGGGGGGATIAVKQITIDKTLLDISAVLKEVKTEKIVLHNDGSTAVKVELSSGGAGYVIVLEEKSFEMAPGETKEISFAIIAPETPGIYTGKLIVKEKVTQEILVTLNVKTKNLLFDVIVTIPEEFKILTKDGELKYQVGLIPKGENERIDGTIVYTIKNFDGQTFLDESETVLINGKTTLSKMFLTKTLPVGDYVLGVELTYPGGVATSSAHFEIKESAPWTFKISNLIIILFGLGILILVVAIIIVLKCRKNRKIKHKK